MTDYSKIVRNDDEPDNDDGFEDWLDMLMSSEYHQLASNYIDSGPIKAVGNLEEEWTNVRGTKSACIIFDIQGGFQDWLYIYWKTRVLPYSSDTD